MTFGKVFKTGFAALAFALVTTTAEARGGAVPSGWYEVTDFVADTRIPGMSLCHLVKKDHIAYLPYSFESRGYVMAEDSCKADSFYRLNATQIEEMQNQGLLDSNIPLTPVFSLSQKIKGSLLYVVIGLGVLVAIATKLGGTTGIGGLKSRKSSKQANTRMLAVMCQVAKCDGKIEPGEIATIAAAIKRLTGNNIPVNQIAEVIHNTNLHHDLPHLSALGEGLNTHDRLNLLEAALTVAVSDGSIATEEYAFIQDLSHALQIKADDFRVSLRRIAGTLAPQAA